ncbi:ATP-binding protein [Nocardioides caldifontis]|uniref:ATP-binding protein n=1 Tax=Nocardioides caldifontis TaxID=2588938 RepID=UPI0011DFD11F|nr:LuxR C-terminal-related transcriptional regulator [Nocardioides caldifontis]
MIGRRQELTALRKRLTGDARLLTLTGPGGIGKSCLARTAAAELERGFEHGTAVLDLDEVAEPALLGAAVSRALGVHLQGDEWELRHLTEVLGDHEVLLVLDGFDRVLEPCAALVTGLLSACPRVRVLATGRQPLRVAGEVVQPVGPLSHPGTGDPVDAATAPSYDAVALFVERARGAVPTFTLTEENVAAVAEICATLGGVPLAVELAAARVLVLSPQGIAERLQDRYRLLTKGARGAPAAQQSLRASVDASHELCEPGEQTLWARLSVFAGSFDLEAAETVCSGDGIDEWEVLDLIDSLLERSVLLRDEDDGSTVRYRMLETIRAYGEQRLEAGERERWQERHLEWCVDLAARFRAEWFGDRQPAWARRMRRETANLQAALERGTRAPATAGLALRLVCDLEPYWIVTGRVGEERRWIERATAAAGAEGAGLDPLLEVRALGVGAGLAVVRGDLHGVGALVETAERLLTAHDLDDLDHLDGVAPLTTLRRAQGTARCWAGDVAGGRRLLEDAAARSASAGDRYGEALGHLALGMCLLLAGDRAGADAALGSAARVGESVGDVHVRSYALGLTALAAASAGEWHGAEEAARESLGMRAALGDDLGVAFALEVLAAAAAEHGDPERAAVLFGSAETWRRAVGLAPQASPGWDELRQRGWERAREGLGARRFDAHARRGRELGREQSIRFARDGEPVESVTAAPAPQRDDDVPLTPREAEVARLVGQGMSNREIAEALVISHRTAQGHVEHILRKLGFTSRTQVAAWVAERQARSMLR